MGSKNGGKHRKPNGNCGIAVEESAPEPGGTTALVPIRGDLALPQDFISTLEQSQSLAEITPEDRLIPHECFNVKLQKDGQWIPTNRFFNTVTEEVNEEINAALLFLKKSRKYVVWDEDAGSTLMCHSIDLETGNWQEPAEYKRCEICPLQRWNGNGRNSEPPKCKLVWNFVGVNLKNGDPFIVSAKSTSMKPVRSFLNRHFIGKLRGKNLPLFCYAVRLRLYQPTGTYAVLQPEVGPTFGREEIETWHRLSQELWNSRRIDLTQTPPEEVETPSPQGKEDENLPF